MLLTRERTWDSVASTHDLLDDKCRAPFNAVVFTTRLTAGSAVVRDLSRTTDGGQTWVGTRQIVGAPADLYVFNLSASPGGPAAAVGLAGSVLVSGDGGAIWESRSVETSAGLFAIAWKGENGIAAGDRGVLYMTSDGGRTWTDAKRPKLFNWLAGATFNGDGQAIVVGERGIVLRSEDRGASWVAAVTPSSKTGLEPPISLGGAEGTPADVSPAPGVP